MNMNLTFLTHDIGSTYIEAQRVCASKGDIGTKVWKWNSFVFFLSFLCLPLVPLIGYRHKGLQTETFVPIECSRRGYWHKGLMPKRILAPRFQEFICLYYDHLLSSLCASNMLLAQGLHKSAIICIKFDIWVETGRM